LTDTMNRKPEPFMEFEGFGFGDRNQGVQTDRQGAEDACGD
jgi:hypothetical protein